MPGRVEEHPEGRAGLVLVLDCAESQHGCLGGVEIVDDHVEMHLLRNVLARPGGQSVGLHLLEGDALAVVRADLCPVGRDRDLPVQQRAVKRRKGALVGTVDDEAWETCDSHPGTLRGPASDILALTANRHPGVAGSSACVDTVADVSLC